MRLLAYWLGLLLIATVTQSAAAQCQMTRLTSVPMDRESAIPVVRVLINGQEARFALTPAPQTSIIRYSTAKKLHLAMSEHTDNVVVYSGTQLQWRTVANTFAVGQEVFPSFMMYVGGHLSHAWDVLPFDGFLSFASIQPTDVEMDFKLGNFNLYSAKDCKDGEVVYWTSAAAAAIPFELTRAGNMVGNIPVSDELTFDAELDGKPVKAMLMPEVPPSVLSLPDARNLFGGSAINADLVRPPPPPYSWLFSKRDGIFRHSFKELAFEGIGIKNPEIILLNRPTSHFLYVGSDLLRAFHVYISYDQKKMYLTAADAH